MKIVVPAVENPDIDQNASSKLLTVPLEYERQGAKKCEYQPYARNDYTSSYFHILFPAMKWVNTTIPVMIVTSANKRRLMHSIPVHKYTSKCLQRYFNKY